MRSRSSKCTLHRYTLPRARRFLYIYVYMWMRKAADMQNAHGRWQRRARVRDSHKQERKRAPDVRKPHLRWQRRTHGRNPHEQRRKRAADVRTAHGRWRRETPMGELHEQDQMRSRGCADSPPEMAEQNSHEQIARTGPELEKQATAAAPATEKGRHPLGCRSSFLHWSGSPAPRPRHASRRFLALERPSDPAA